VFLKLIGADNEVYSLLSVYQHDTSLYGSICLGVTRFGAISSLKVPTVTVLDISVPVVLLI
jgi:hypothetical protein